MPTVTIELDAYDRLRKELDKKTEIIEAMREDCSACLVVPKCVHQIWDANIYTLTIYSTKCLLNLLDQALIEEVTSLATELQKEREKGAERERFYKLKYEQDTSYTVPNEIYDKPKRWWQRDR